MTREQPEYIHCIPVPTPFAVGPVNVYLLEGAPLTLFDVGPRDDPARTVLEEGLAAFGYRPADVGRIVLSHTHSDHCGLAAELVRASGAQVLCHPYSVAELAQYAGERARRLQFYAALMESAGVPPETIAQIAQTRGGYGSLSEAVQPDGTLDEGDVIRLGDEEWRVLHTPGHNGGLICLYQPQRRLLLSSDFLLRDVSSNPIVEPPERPGEPRPRRLLDYVRQLERAAQMEIELALPGHGAPVTDVAGLIAERLSFHRERSQRILAALNGTPRTVYEISMVIFPRLDPLNRFLALFEVIGHLDWLEAEGRVECRADGARQTWVGCA